MRCCIATLVTIALALPVASPARAQPATAGLPATQPLGTAATGKLPHLLVDVKARLVRVECEALNVQMPLEFFCVLKGTNEHESALRSAVKPSDLHLALLMLGLKPGEPVRYSRAADKWFPPHGPPLQISVEYQKPDGQIVREPAYRWIRNTKTKQECPPLTWIFAGSRVMDDGVYAADVTGYLVSVVNFDLTVIDIPTLASSANETLEWEANLDRMPKTGTKVWMIIEPAGAAPKEPAPPAPPAGNAAPPESSNGPGAAATRPMTSLDDAHVQALRRRWEQAVAPRGAVLREAAQAHYEVIGELRREQQRLIDDADRIQRLIDRLEKEYQRMTTPQPADRR